MIKIGIVGTGGMGTVHYHNYKEIDNCEVVAFVGTTDQDREKVKSWNLPIYETIDEMLDNHELDVVDVCTPTFLHYEHIKSALNRDVHVISEKPLALKSSHARELIELAKSKGKFLFVAHVVQFMRQTEILHELVKNETYGKPLDAYFERLSTIPRWAQGSWLFDKEKAGLIPFDLHIHDLDMIVSLFGKPESFDFMSSKGVSDFPEHYRFIYKYQNLNVVAEAAWFNANIPFTARWRVYFEKGYVVNDGETLIAYPEQGEPVVYDVEEKLKIETGINVPPTGMYYFELKHFLECIEESKQSPRITDEQVINVLEILEDISKRS